MTSPEGHRPTALDAISELLDLRPDAKASTSTGPRLRFGVVAGRSDPRFLVPLDHRDAAPQACLAYLGLRDVKTRFTRGTVGLALRFGAGSVVIRKVLQADAGPGSLLAALAETLGAAAPSELAVAVGLPQVDEVWKPTLQVFHPDGSPAAFVKVGSGPVGAHLVRTEATTLAAWQQCPDPRLVVPGLLAELEWRGMPIAVVEPLPTDARRLPPGRTTGANPVRLLDGEPAQAALEKAPWWTDRRQAEADDPAIDALLEQIEVRHRSSTWSWARWHGDWVPWNLGRCRRGLLAWDWEYSEPGAPVGLDEVHGAYQVARIARGKPIADALAAARHEAAAIAPDDASAAWLADAHVAMLVTRNAQLARLLGSPVPGQRELLAAGRAALAIRTAIAEAPDR